MIPQTMLGLGITATLIVNSGPGPSPLCTLPPLGPGGGPGGITDTTPPILVGLCLSSYTIDVRTGPQTVSVFLNVTDDLSGFQYGYVYLYSPTGLQNQNIYIPDWTRTQGNSLSGIYVASLTIPAGAEAGTWTISAFPHRPRRRSSTRSTPRVHRPPSQWCPSRIPRPPVLKSVTFTPAAVNVSGGSQTATVALHITDDLSGVDMTSGRSLSFDHQSIRTPEYLLEYWQPDADIRYRQRRSLARRRHDSPIQRIGRLEDWIFGDLRSGRQRALCESRFRDCSGDQFCGSFQPVRHVAAQHRTASASPRRWSTLRSPIRP